MGFVERHFHNKSGSVWKVLMYGDYVFVAWYGSPRFPSLPRERNPIVLGPGDYVKIKFYTSSATKQKYRGRTVPYQGSRHTIEGAGTVELTNESNGNKVKFKFGVGGTHAVSLFKDDTQVVFATDDHHQLADDAFRAKGVDLNSVTDAGNRCVGNLTFV